MQDSDLTAEAEAPNAGSPPAPDAAYGDQPAPVKPGVSADDTNEAGVHRARAAGARGDCKRRNPSSVSGSSEPEAVPAAAAAAAAVTAGPSNPAATADITGTSAAAAAAATAAADHIDEDGDAETGLASNLADADCVPGTEEFAAAKAKNDDKLQKYQHRVRMHTSQERAKPDMIAFKELRKDLTPANPIYGHIPGVQVADDFSGRGELAILGLHTSMMRGIMSYKEHGPAYAICLAGGYKDDADDGNVFWYTGQGGQEKKKQVKDQEFVTPDNAALVENVKTKTPVRVFRGKAADKDGKVERRYVYEGLYRVTEFKREASQDGPMVCKFKMEGMPGHSAVSSKVDYKLFGKNPFSVRNLANAAGRPRVGSKRGRPISMKEYTRQQLEEMIQQRAAAGNHGRLVSSDLAGGLEKVPIAVWNDIDDDDDILLPEADGHVPEFLYIEDYKFGEKPAKDVAIEAERLFGISCPITCGIEFGGGRKDKRFHNYNSDGLMMCTHPCGIMECDQDCRCFRQCKNNHVVTKGIRYPLEVYKVSQHKRWGVRCATDLSIGAVVCCYIGLVITDESAEQLRNQDLYLFDLNHFHLLAEAEENDHLPDVQLNPSLPELPQELKPKHLVVDAHRQGNIGRFLNHSCDPNCLVQTVFAGHARSQLLYYIAIVALKDIPMFTELTYDYGYSRGTMDLQSSGEGQDVRINCTCGAPNCSGRLI